MLCYHRPTKGNEETRPPAWVVSNPHIFHIPARKGNSLRNVRRKWRGCSRNRTHIVTFVPAFAVYLVSLGSQFAFESRYIPPGGSLIDQAVDFGATANTRR